MDCVCRVPGLGGWLECPPEAKGQLFQTRPDDWREPAGIIPASVGTAMLGIGIYSPATKVLRKAYQPGASVKYSGDFCHECDSHRMTRSGTCLVCLDCGSTSGGCS